MIVPLSELVRTIDTKCSMCLCMTNQFCVCCLPVMFTDCFYDDVKEEVTI